MWHFLVVVQAIPILLLFLKCCLWLSGRRSWKRLSFSLMLRSLPQSFLRTFGSTSKNVCIYSPSPWLLTRLVDTEHRWLPHVIIWTGVEAFVCQLIKGYDGGYRWTTQWMGTLGEVWEGLEHRSFCPRGVGVGHPPGVDMFPHVEALWTLYIGNLCRLPHVGMINY